MPRGRKKTVKQQVLSSDDNIDGYKEKEPQNVEPNWVDQEGA